jgi:hypothetical protein
MNTSRENFIASAALVIEDYCGIKLPIEKVSEIIGDKMDSEWKTFEYKEVSPFMDTAPREDVMEIVAQHFLGRSWPTYGDDIDINDWIMTLNATMKEKS